MCPCSSCTRLQSYRCLRKCVALLIELQVRFSGLGPCRLGAWIGIFMSSHQQGRIAIVRFRSGKRTWTLGTGLIPPWITCLHPTLSLHPLLSLCSLHSFTRTQFAGLLFRCLGCVGTDIRTLLFGLFTPTQQSNYTSIDSVLKCVHGVFFDFRVGSGLFAA